MKVLVCGDRNWTDMQKIRVRLSQLPPGTVIIEGECRGADRMAARAARELGFKVDPYPADWKHHGNAAGPIRNSRMLNQWPDLVIAFHSDLDRSAGTADTVRKARSRRIPVEIID
jgi:hypothetical protein